MGISLKFITALERGSMEISCSTLSVVPKASASTGTEHNLRFKQASKASWRKPTPPSLSHLPAARSYGVMGRARGGIDDLSATLLRAPATSLSLRFKRLSLYKLNGCQNRHSRLAHPCVPDCLSASDVAATLWCVSVVESSCARLKVERLSALQAENART